MWGIQDQTLCPEKEQELINYKEAGKIKKERKKQTSIRELTKQIAQVKSVSSFTESNRPQERIGFSSLNLREQSPNSPGRATLLIFLLALKLM